jgi:hypothetical protein
MAWRGVEIIKMEMKKKFGVKDKEKLVQENLHLLDLVTNLQRELKPYRKKKLKEISKLKVQK